MGQSHSRCGFLLLASALESRDTPTCSDIQKQQLSMFIVTTFFTTPISTAPSSCSHFVPSGYNFTPKVAQTQTLFASLVLMPQAGSLGQRLPSYLSTSFLPNLCQLTDRQTLMPYGIKCTSKAFLLTCKLSKNLTLRKLRTKIFSPWFLESETGQWSSFGIGQL